ncbi:MAG: neutral/alkaline non-lysosomal ceramidase N-terminal domain-containing protein [Gemmataceae bacterium]
MRVALTLAVCLWLGSDGRAAELRAGAATIDITPPTGYAMWGYASRKDAPSDGVLEPLKARALVLTVGETSIALVSLDLGRSPTRESFARIRAKTKKDAGIEHLFLVASHTHHGPVLELEDWPTPEKSYVHELEGKLAKVIVEAAEARQPARLGIVEKEVDANRNRHWRRPDPPVDRALLVLRVEDLKGKPIAHAVNFAAHPTMLDRKVHKFAPDYVGALCAAVEKKTEVPCLFLQGACGDLSPNPRGQADPAAFGKYVAGLVLELIPKIECKEGADATLKVAHETLRFKGRLDLSNVVVRGALGYAFYPELIKFYEREYREGVRPCLSVAVLDGRIGIVGVSGEVFCGHSLHLKKRAGLEHLLFLGYCNDYQQYFPTIESAAQGGYGTEPYIASAEIGAGERIMDRALTLLFELRGKLKK